ncbi:hypothetical protein C0W66_01825 [Photobacterium kishitanii]|nr:hypothetical protein AYY23_16805 [Photobacterium kishitanii]PSW51580.1 hypothetical protein C0W66_01825 [Photobacterium kishitanii]
MHNKFDKKQTNVVIYNLMAVAKDSIAGHGLIIYWGSGNILLFNKRKRTYTYLRFIKYVRD